MFSLREALPVSKANALYQHKDLDWAIATPDYFVCEKIDSLPTDLTPIGILECKSTTARSASYWDEDTAPSSAHCQLIWQLGVCGDLLRGWVGGLIGGDPRDFYSPHFEFDDSVFAQLVEVAEQFLKMVREDIPPDPGAGDSKLIEQIVGIRKSEAMIFSQEGADEAENIMQSLRKIKEEKSKINAQLKAVEIKAKEFENILKLMLGDSSQGLLPDGRVIEIKAVNVGSKEVKGYSFTKLKLPKEA